MCSHFESVTKKEVIKQYFDAEVTSEDAKADIWPGYKGLLIRPTTGSGREAISGAFGLIPHWASDTKISRHTYNARTETVASKPSFREAWKKAQHCIIPAAAIFEPDWRSGKAIPTRIYQEDGHPMGIAGLWDCWQPDKGDPVLSFTMLTVNADQHPPDATVPQACGRETYGGNPARGAIRGLACRESIREHGFHAALPRREAGDIRKSGRKTGQPQG